MMIKTILRRISGRRFIVMTGSKNFVDMGNDLRISFARSKTSASCPDIIYNAGLDLYSMHFHYKTLSGETFKCRMKDIETYEDIYYDVLEEMFTTVAGLYTRL